MTDRVSVAAMTTTTSEEEAVEVGFRFEAKVTREEEEEEDGFATTITTIYL